MKYNKNSYQYCNSLTSYSRFKTREVNIGDISLDDYNVSIDYNENILRPSFVKSFESPVKTDDEKQSSITVSDTPISDVHNLRGYGHLRGNERGR